MSPCLQCRNSKKRCDRLTPCSRCVKYQLPCAYTLTNPFQRPSTKLQRLHVSIDKIEKEIKGSWYQFKLWEGIWKEFQGGNERKWSWTRVKLEEDGDSDGLVRHPHPVVLYRWKRRGKDSFYSSSETNSNASQFGSDGSSSPSMYKEVSLSTLLARHMLDLYIEKLHPIYPFINPRRLENEFKERPMSSPLLTSVYLKSYYVTLGQQDCVNIPPLQYSPFYHRACYLIQMAKIEERDLSWVQGCLILVGMELAHLIAPEVHQRIMHAVRQAQMLFINDKQSLSRVNDDWETRVEGDNTWRMCIVYDTLISVHLDTPPIIREYYGEEAIMPDQLPSPQDPMLHAVHLMEQHKYWCHLVTEMRRIKCVFDPKTATHSQAFALHLMLNQVQERFPRLWNPTRLSLKLDQPFLTGYLVLYLIHLVLVVDLTEMLLVCPDQPNTPEPQGENYLDIQHQAAILLIEAMFPHPITQASRSIPPQLQKIEVLDYLFTMAVFHACKVLVHESEPGAVEYFYKVKDTCLNTLELFPCNYQIKLFFDYYWEHPSKVKRKIGKGTIGLVSGFEI